MKDKVLQKLREHSSKLVFDEETHTYTYKGKTLTSVSETLSFFKSSLASIPSEVLGKAIVRGKFIHKIAEDYVNFLIATDTPIAYSILKEFAVAEEGYKEEYDMYLANLYMYLEMEFSNNWKPLATEIKMFSNADGVAGTVDILLYKETNDEFIIKISDYKTGQLRLSNYPQVSIYQYMLKKVLKGLKTPDKPIRIITDLISLKDLEDK